MIDESDTVVPKYAQCNNCGTIHKVYDICKSEIITGKDEMKSTSKIEDFKFRLPNDLVNLLVNYNCEISIWGNVYFAFSNEKWGTKIILTRESINDETFGKVLNIKNERQFLVEDFIINESLTLP